MLADIAMLSPGFRLCRRAALLTLAGFIAIEATLLILAHSLFQETLFRTLENSTKTIISELYVNVPDQTNASIRQVTRKLIDRGTLAGGILFDGNDKELDRFGILANKDTASADSRWLDRRWSSAQLGIPFSLLARIDTQAVRVELAASFWLIAVIALVATLFLAAFSLTIFRRQILDRLMKLNNGLLRVSQDLSNCQQYMQPYTDSDDELGDVISAANLVLEQVALSHRDSLYTVKTMADRAAVAILTYDAAGKIHYANQSCFRLCNFHSLDEMQATDLPKFEFASESAPQTLPESTITGPYSREAVLIGRDGKRSAVVVNAARVPEDSTSEVRYYASITDISDLRVAEQQLRKQNVELEAANRAKSQFLANMSHELRTPLNAVIGFSEMFVSETFGPLGSEHYQEYAQDIHNSGTHLLGIINDILDLSKIEAGRMDLHEDHLELAHIIEATVRIVHERAADTEIKLTTQLPDDLPKLNADERGVKQMLINLLSNAIKFTEPGGSVTIGAAYRDGCILLGVADSGVGMTKDDALIAMKPFGMVDDSNTRQQEGTGLGLPLVKSLIELHGGRIRIDSARQRGTTVTLTFPAERTILSIAENEADRSVA